MGINHLEQYRQQFPALANKTYFNYGGQGPMPWVALEAIREAHEQIQSRGPFTGATNEWLNQETVQTRQTIATELTVPTDTITLTENVSIGCNIILWGIDWNAGDHILLTDCEHPSVVATVQEIQNRVFVEVSVCPLRDAVDREDPIAIIREYLQPNTRLVCLSHVLWNTGQVLPLTEIVTACHSVNALVLVDAAQSVGLLPLDLTATKVDFYAFTGHKWWCGPAGLGGLYVRPDRLETLRPTFMGWRGITSTPMGDPMGWQRGGVRFEVATSDYALYAGLRAAIAVHQSWGSAQDRYQRILALSRYLWQQLRQSPGITCLRQHPPDSGLISFQLAGYEQKPYGQLHNQVVKWLESETLMVRTLRNPDCIRACVHYFTTEAEIDRLVAALSAHR
nr:aminotransferase class V-fold PLP-dependent enzyme [Leptolyngbya sp. 'hensonii']